MVDEGNKIMYRRNDKVRSCPMNVDDDGSMMDG